MSVLAQAAGGRSAPVRSAPVRPAPVRFAGYAGLFDIRDAAHDTIRRGAFAETLAMLREPLPLLWQHRPDQRIGTVEAIAEDARGLRIIARIDRPGARAAHLLRARAVSGLSFGYRARDYHHLPGGRVLDRVDLIEVSLVSRPMQHGARVHLVT